MEKIFEKVVQIVSEHTGATENEILYGKTEEFVNYRAIVVCTLYDLGLKDTAISRYINVTRQGVNKLRNSLPYRKKHNLILSTTCQHISNHIATINLISNPI